MTYKLVNGDYIKAEGEKDLQKCDYIDEILQSVTMALNAKRRKFYPNKNFGSFIKYPLRKPITEYAAAYARQALEAFDGVFVKEVSALDGGRIIDINLLINDTERKVRMEFNADI